jgi:hypothetical protein
MGNFALRKLIREAINEYGNFAFHKANIYFSDGSMFPEYDKEKIKIPTEIDFWNDLEFGTDEDIPISESDDSKIDDLESDDTGEA